MRFLILVSLSILIFNISSLLANAQINNNLNCNVPYIDNYQFTYRIGGNGDTSIVPCTDTIRGLVVLTGDIRYPLEFENTVFLNDVLFQYANFYDDVSFISSKFLGRILFNKVRFQGYITFVGSYFCRKSTFRRCYFSNSIDMNECTFNEEVGFPESSIKGQFSFTRTYFEDALNLYYIDLSECNKVIFEAASFAKNILFDGATLCDTIFLKHCQLGADVDFSTSNINTQSIIYIDIQGTDISKLIIDFTTFSLLVDKSLSVDNINMLFLKLIQKQKLDGFNNSCKKLDLQYRHTYNETRKSLLSTCSYLFQKIWWNFGYDKWLIFVHILWVFSFFTILNTTKISDLLENVYSIPNLKKALTPKLSNNNRFGLLKKTFISFWFTAIVFFGIKLDINAFNFKRMRSVVYIFVIYIIGLTCTAFVINYVFTL